MGVGNRSDCPSFLKDGICKFHGGRAPALSGGESGKDGSQQQLSLVRTVTPLTFSDDACDHRASKLELGLFFFRLASLSKFNFFHRDGKRRKLLPKFDLKDTRAESPLCDVTDSSISIYPAADGNFPR